MSESSIYIEKNKNLFTNWITKKHYKNDKELNALYDEFITMVVNVMYIVSYYIKN